MKKNADRLIVVDVWCDDYFIVCYGHSNNYWDISYTIRTRSGFKRFYRYGEAWKQRSQMLKQYEI